MEKPLDGSVYGKIWKTGKPEAAARISCASPELFWRVLTAKRWELLKVLCGAEPVSIREAARRAGRDVKAVEGGIVEESASKESRPHGSSTFSEGDKGVGKVNVE
ncbi:MAG: hypothetical protein LBT74_00470 [Acidobacteriota bacterium]|nr:hypothetical protein [Acidobacteriota bacterium]